MNLVNPDNPVILSKNHEKLPSCTFPCEARAAGYTRVYQTDDPDEGRRLAAEPGYWPVPHEVRFRVFRGFAITSNSR